MRRGRCAAWSSIIAARKGRRSAAAISRSCRSTTWPPPPRTPARFEQLDQALQELEALDPPLAQLVDLKFFCGFTFGELAAMRGVSERTVRRDWEKARLLLHQAIGEAE